MRIGALCIAAGLTVTMAVTVLAPQVAAASGTKTSHATTSLSKWPDCLMGGASYNHDPGIGKTATIEVSRGYPVPVALSWDAGSITVLEVSRTQVSLVSATPAAGWTETLLPSPNHPVIRFVETGTQWMLRVNAYPTAQIRITTTVEVCSTVPWTP